MPSLEELENMPIAEEAPEEVVEAVVETISDGDPDKTVAGSILAGGPPTGGKRSAALAQTRDAKMDQLFSGKKFEVLGEVHLEKDKFFTTPLGNKGRNGFVVREIGTENQFAVGRTTLELMASKYDAVVVPPKAKKAKATADAD